MQNALELADMLTNGVLRYRSWTHSIPLTVALRFVLLFEMISLSETGCWPDLVDQCKLLASAGWGFAGDVPQWDALLRHFGAAKGLDQAVGDLGVLLPQSVRLSSMAELRHRAPKSGPVSRLEISAARLSRHFEAFAVNVAANLEDAGWVDGVAMSDLYVTLAWGYPGKSLVPSELADAVGRARIKHWLGCGVRP
jgi:hypothetical protein